MWKGGGEEEDLRRALWGGCPADLPRFLRSFRSHRPNILLGLLGLDWTSISLVSLLPFQQDPEGEIGKTVAPPFGPLGQ